jgi:hypothetical protein
MRLRIIVLLTLALTAATASAQSAQPTRAVQKNAVTIGDASMQALGVDEAFPSVAAIQDPTVPDRILVQPDPVDPEPCVKHIWNDCGASANPTSCQSDVQCSLVAKACKSHTGSKCYSWIDADAIDHCKAC